MKTYKLHELIEMAQAGKKFEASRSSEDNWFLQDVFLKKEGVYWFSSDIVIDWTVKFNTEKEKYEIEVKFLHESRHGLDFVYPYSISRGFIMNWHSLLGKNYKMTLEQVVE